MEEDEMPAQGCKFPRNHNSNGKMESVKGGGGLDEEDGDEEVKRGRVGGGSGTGGGGRGGNISQVVDISNSGGPLSSRLCNWPSSRIFRVSRASGGKDRHSKVWTSKGLRDRRVRLSVPTAIQFYDLQDRLGYDQPSKAVEWLLGAAATSISELPSISTPFPDTPQQLTDGRRSSGGDNEKRFDLAEVDVDDDDDDENMMMQQQQDGNGNVVKSLSKSGCSSTSETSKGSGLSFSRPESRIKARERARERAAGKEKEKEMEENEGSRQRRHQNLNPISQNASFTELLTGGGGGNGHNSPNGNGHSNAQREWISPSTSMDYFGTGLLNSSTSRPPMNSTNFLGQIQLGNPIHQQFSVTGDQNQQYSFLPDHLVVRGGGGGGSNSNNNCDYNLNFSVTCSSSPSGLAGFNRGTLQSNSSSSPSMLPHHNQRFLDGTSANFFLSPTTPVVVTNASAHVAPVENHYHHFLSGFDPQLQLCYDNNTNNRHHDHKGKGKNSAS